MPFHILQNKIFDKVLMRIDINWKAYKLRVSRYKHFGQWLDTVNIVKVNHNLWAQNPLAWFILSTNVFPSTQAHAPHYSSWHSRKPRATQIPTNSGRNKETVVCCYKGKLFHMDTKPELPAKHIYGRIKK